MHNSIWTETHTDRQIDFSLKKLRSVKKTKLFGDHCFRGLRTRSIKNIFELLEEVKTTYVFLSFLKNVKETCARILPYLWENHS